jgi:hypothetical protein
VYDNGEEDRGKEGTARLVESRGRIVWAVELVVASADGDGVRFKVERPPLDLPMEMECTLKTNGHLCRWRWSPP